MATVTEVVVVDDEPAVRNLVAEVLTSEGYRVQTAPDGAAALDLLKHSSPSVIVLDLQMPVMNGAEFIRQYRKLPHPHARVIVISSAPKIGRRFGINGRWVEVDADGYLRKPFDLDALIRIVKQHASPSDHSFERSSLSVETMP